MKQLIKWSLLLFLVFVFLPGCAVLEGQRGTLDVVGTTPAPVTAGLKCRLLDGNIEAGAASIQGEGFRCTQYGNGNDTFKGCVTWKEDGMSFWSAGCFAQPLETKSSVPEPAAPDAPVAPDS